MLKVHKCTDKLPKKAPGPIGIKHQDELKTESKLFQRFPFDKT